MSVKSPKYRALMYLVLGIVQLECFMRPTSSRIVVKGLIHLASRPISGPNLGDERWRKLTDMIQRQG